MALDMLVALDILRAKSGLALATQAMAVLRQGLYQTINSEACQLRVKQEEAFRTRDQWLQDTQIDTFVANTMKVVEGESNEANPA